jgi:hypothetical protein
MFIGLCREYQRIYRYRRERNQFYVCTSQFIERNFVTNYFLYVCVYIYIGV